MGLGCLWTDIFYLVNVVRFVVISRLDDVEHKPGSQFNNPLQGRVLQIIDSILYFLKASFM